MGCNVSPYRGGVLKYKETVTGTIASMAKDDIESIFVPSRNCIVKVCGPICGAVVSYINLYINGTYAANTDSDKNNYYTNLGDVPEILTSSANPSQNANRYRELLLILKPNDMVQFKLTYGTLTNVGYKIYVYEWE